MRVLLDENVPVDILPVLRAAGIEAESVNFIGWKRLKNGELIIRARAQFNLLLTRDKDFDEEYLKCERGNRCGRGSDRSGDGLLDAAGQAR